jgi:hypothetical protein
MPLVLHPLAVEVVDRPVGRLTALSSGAAVFDAQQWLCHLDAAGLTPRDLMELAEFLEAAAYGESAERQD